MKADDNKIHIALNGACGRMCKAIFDATASSDKFEIAFGVDRTPLDSPRDFEVYPDFEGAPDCDVAVDFSYHTATQSALDFAVSRRIPIVVATTGHTDAERQAVFKAGNDVPVFFAQNVSIGIYLSALLAKTAAEFLDDNFDVEIIETHHRAKADFPSGTALTLANAVASAKSKRGDEIELGINQSGPREKSQIRIHSLRGGTVVGKHQVIFLGNGESLSITHETESKTVYVDGVFKAIEFLLKQPAGVYGMNELLSHALKPK